VDGLLQSSIEREIVGPVLAGMAAEGHPFRGFLYCGLMITADGPKVIEFNVRFGDPEAEVVLPLVEGDLSSLLLAAARGALHREAFPSAGRASGCAVGVVLAAAGYPGEPRAGDRVAGLDHLGHEYPDVLAFFAGVKASGSDLVTAGGRVLTLVAREATFDKAIARVYDAASRVRFEGMQFRTDIGRKALGRF
jgi:phosphoribosylamine--glycine ligase